MRQMDPLKPGSKETPHRGGASCAKQVTAGRLSAALPLQPDHRQTADDLLTRMTKALVVARLLQRDPLGIVIASQLQADL